MGQNNTSQNIAKTRDGIELHYTIHKGNGPGRTVLIHSLAIDQTFWNEVLPFLRDHGDVLVYDCRCHGRSTKVPGPQPVECHADDLNDLLAAVGWQRPVVAGASMGGCIALAFAQRYPNKVGGLGLIDTTAWYGPEAPKQWEERGQKAVAEGMAALVPFQKQRWVTERFLKEHADIVERAIAVFVANDPKIYLETCRMLGTADLRKLPAFDFPTRVVVGIEDYATPVAMAEALHKLIPGSTLTVIDNARHLTPLETPDRISDELKQLITARRA